MTEIHPLFQYHMPTPDQLEHVTAMREAASRSRLDILEHAPDCRARSLALTHLEEAAMWAIKAIVLGNGTNQR